VYRAWDGHAVWDEAGGTRNRKRLLAIVSLRSDHAPARHEPFPARFAAADIPLEDYRYNEVRFKSLTQTRPDDARHMLAQAQLELQEKYRIYEDLAARDGSRFHPHWEEV
jgi:hypothetical protein